MSRTLRYFCIGCTLWLLPMLLLADENVFIVAHAPAAVEIDADVLRRAVKGQVRSWRNGQAMTVVLPGKASSDHDPIAQACFGLSGKGMQREWLKLVFSGRANAPVYADDMKQLYEHVRDNAGSIGVLTVRPSPSPGLMILDW